MKHGGWARTQARQWFLLFDSQLPVECSAPGWSSVHTCSMAVTPDHPPGAPLLNDSWVHLHLSVPIPTTLVHYCSFGLQVSPNCPHSILFSPRSQCDLLETNIQLCFFPTIIPSVTSMVLMAKSSNLLKVTQPVSGSFLRPEGYWCLHSPRWSKAMAFSQKLHQDLLAGLLTLVAGPT